MSANSRRLSVHRENICLDISFYRMTSNSECNNEVTGPQADVSGMYPRNAVPLGNSDPADRLRVDPLSFASSRDFVTRRFRGGAGCRPQPRSPAHGGSRPPSSADRSAAVGQASQTDSSRPVAMGDTGRILAGLAISTGDRPSGDGHLMAPERESPVLDVEVASGTSGASSRFGRNAPTDSHDEPQQSALGRTADSWGTPQTRHRCRRD
jgi:hypothetical protein